MLFSMIHAQPLLKDARIIHGQPLLKVAKLSNFEQGLSMNHGLTNHLNMKDKYDNTAVIIHTSLIASQD